MKKFIKPLLKFLFVFIILGGILTTAVIFVVSERPTYSDTEKRPLAAKPKITFKRLITGSYFTELQIYYNDTIPDRENIKLTGDKILSLRGVTKDDIIIIDNFDPYSTEEPDDDEDETPDPAITHQPRATIEPDDEETEIPATATPDITASDGESTNVPENTATPTPSPTEVPPTQNPTATPTDSGGQEELIDYSSKGSLIYNKRGLDIFGGSKKATRRYVACIERIKEKCPNVNVYNMTVPLSSIYYMPAKFQGNVQEQLDMLNYLEGLFSSNVKVVRVYEALGAHKDEDIYLRTDHHWAYLGVYYAMREFAYAAGVPFDDISAYQPKTRDGYLGSYYSYYKMRQLASYPETFTYYVSSRNVTAHYYDTNTFKLRTDISQVTYFENIGVNNSYVTVGYFDEYIQMYDTDANTGRVLLILKDSFGIPTPGFLFGSFDKIIMIDPRYYTMDVYQLIDRYGVTDFLSIANIFSHTSSDFAPKYEYVCY